MPETLSAAERTDLQVGLRMAHPPDPGALAEERQRLAELDSAPRKTRWRAFAGLIGPGYMQSAMTLGSGTAASALFAGAVFGYQLLWVAPLAMLLGLVMLSAVAHQTLSTGVRPFDAMRRFAGAPLAWSWALGALIASIVWHFPQYALASAVLVDLGEAAGVEGLPASALGFVVLFWAILISSLYGRRPELIRVYERLLRYMVWGIVFCFAWVVLRTGVSDWGALLRGFVGFAVPGERNGVLGVTVILSGLSAAVGINMVFLYPYSLLARGWSREHRSLARFDLWTGTFVPYVLAASLMVIAAANTIHLDPAYDGTRLGPVEAAKSLAAVAGPAVGRVVFDLGVLGMALSTITLHMLATGFVACELFGWRFGGRKHRLAMLLPAPGVLGPVFWGDIAVWLAVPTNIVCGLFLPAAYIGFVILQRKRGYLGEDRPEGARGWLWWGLMVGVTVFLTAFMAWYVFTQGPGYFGRLIG